MGKLSTYHVGQPENQAGLKVDCLAIAGLKPAGGRRKKNNAGDSR